MRTRALDIAYGAVLLGGALYLYWVSVDTGVAARRVASDPMWYPQVLLVLLILCSGYLLLRSVWRRDGAAVRPLEWKPLAITLAAAGLYLATFDRFGFVPCTLVMVPVTGWLLGFRRSWLLALVTVGFTAVVWYSFHYLLNATPPGPALPVFGG